MISGLINKLWLSVFVKVLKDPVDLKDLLFLLLLLLTLLIMKGVLSV